MISQLEVSLISRLASGDSVEDGTRDGSSSAGICLLLTFLIIANFGTDSRNSF